MATCGNCKATGQTIAHIKACYEQGAPVSTPSPAPAQLPALAPGNVVTLANESGFWTVEHVADNGPWVGVVQEAATRSGETSRTPDLADVELFFPNMQAATDWRIAWGQAAERERVSQALHGRPAQERGYYASAYETRGDATTGIRPMYFDEPNGPTVEVPGLPGVRVPAQPAGNVWGTVDELRKQVAAHLHYETNQGSAKKRQGYFAIEAEGTLKFLRIKKILTGRYAGRVFVDSMGSSTAYPVKAPATLENYLAAVLVDPAAAAKRFADELDMCSDCGRPLTNEVSRARGVGPECWSKR